MPRRSPDSLTLYAKHLSTLPFVRSVRLEERAARGGGDAIAQLRLSDGSTLRLQVEVKVSHLGTNATGVLRAGLATPSEWLVAAPYIGAPLGAALEERGINFVDRQGNCYLRVDDRFVARIQKSSAQKPPAHEKEMRAPSYQVLFALLADPERVSAPQREIAAAAGTSRQPVADLLARLAGEAILRRRRGKYTWVEGPDARLLERWIAGYRSTLRPKLVVGRFKLPVRAPKEVEAWLEERLDVVQYGGTAGSYRLARHYRGPFTLVHHDPPSEKTRIALKASPAHDGELIWMRHIGEASRRGATPDTVHPLLVYAELVSDPDPRADEAADLVRRECLPWSL